MIQSYLTRTQEVLFTTSPVNRPKWYKRILEGKKPSG